MIKRCPWCGEITKNNSKGSNIYGKKCLSCGNKYVSYRKTPLYLFFLIMVFLCFILYFVIDTYYFHLPILKGVAFTNIVIIEIVLSKCPYKKEIEHYIIQTRQKSTIKLYDKEISKIRFPHITIIENQIFTVCFVNKNNKPISQMICVATESVKIKNRQCKCILAFLPLGNLDKVYPEGTKFYLFYNKRKIGYGILGEEIKDFKNYL